MGDILGRTWYTARELAKAHTRRLIKARQVRVVTVAPGLAESRHVVVLVVHNEAVRLPFLFDYYRRLGFEHFLVVDNESTDNLTDIVASAPDISLFEARGSYRDARFGNDWINLILSRYCHGKWILYVDADEFLTYARSPETPIAVVTAELEQSGSPALHAMIVDMYSDRPLSANTYVSGADPLATCPMFDTDGYETRFESLSQTTWVKGGVRARLFFQNLWEAPALNKTPLVQWRRHFAFIKSSHQLIPPRLNGPGPQRLANLGGALLHYKFLAPFTEKLAAEESRQQHTQEYSSYTNLLETSFPGPSTARWEGWRTGVAAGLLSSDIAPGAGLTQRARGR